MGHFCALQGNNENGVKVMAKNQHSESVDYETFSKCKSNFDLVLGLFREGLNTTEVCRYIGISKRTYYDWLSKYPEFERATLQGREAADYAVENALYKRAVGFAYAEKKIIKRNGEVVQEEIYQKQALPDSTSCAIWLNNRQSEKWKRNPESNSEAENKAIEINVINAKTVSQKTKNKVKSEKKGDKIKEGKNE